MDYYTRLKDARIDRDMSQTEVAKAIGTTQHQIYKYENGLQQMTVDRFKQFCTLYKVSADYILGLEKGLEWPREEKRKHTDNCTKYTFLYIKSGTPCCSKSVPLFVGLQCFTCRANCRQIG